jgi:AcrR family transcriptional regulator
MKPMRQDTARTRESLLTAASEIFAEKGYRDATIAEISERSGTNIAAVNYHFHDKETLYKEAWRYAFAESIKTHPPDGGVDGNAPPQHRLKGHVTALLRRATDRGNREFLIVLKELAAPTGLLEEVLKEEIIPLRRRITTMVSEILGPGKSEKQVRFCVTSVISQCVIPAFINMVEKTDTEDGSDSLRISDIEAYAEHVVALSLAGMDALRERTKKS